MFSLSEKSYDLIEEFYRILKTPATKLRFDFVDNRPHFPTVIEGTVKERGARFRLLARIEPVRMLSTSNSFR